MSKYDGLTVENILDCREFVEANNNILVIKSVPEISDEVEIIIKNKKGEVEANTVVSGHSLIKAVNNAMND